MSKLLSGAIALSVLTAYTSAGSHCFHKKSKLSTLANAFRYLTDNPTTSHIAFKKHLKIITITSECSLLI